MCCIFRRKKKATSEVSLRTAPSYTTETTAQAPEDTPIHVQSIETNVRQPHIKTPINVRDDRAERKKTKKSRRRYRRNSGKVDTTVERVKLSNSQHKTIRPVERQAKRKINQVKKEDDRDYATISNPDWTMTNSRTQKKANAMTRKKSAEQIQEVTPTENSLTNTKSRQLPNSLNMADAVILFTPPSSDRSPHAAKTRRSQRRRSNSITSKRTRTKQTDGTQESTANNCRNFSPRRK